MVLTTIHHLLHFLLYIIHTVMYMDYQMLNAIDYHNYHTTIKFGQNTELVLKTNPYMQYIYQLAMLYIYAKYTPNHIKQLPW